MANVKKYLGILWLVLGPAIIMMLVYAASQNISSTGTKDFNKPTPWIIIIGVFTPIAIGLMLFGWYALKGLYKKLPATNDEFVVSSE